MFLTLQAGTGTWLGPAPRGAANPEQVAAAAAKAAAAVREPSTVLLSTGQHMPLIGLGTYKLQSAGAVRTALELGYRHFDCECVVCVCRALTAPCLSLTKKPRHGSP